MNPDINATPQSPYFSNSIFWVEVNRIVPNPFQPRKIFDENALADLAESIRQYGVLQPLVVTRRETTREDGGIAVGYELIAGERRLRAARLAGVIQVPVIIRAAEETDKMKLELAIIENLQREDLNPVDRAIAFKDLAEKFNLKHAEIAKKVGKSREYVSNSIRLLMLPPEVLQSLQSNQISEGHARTLLMLIERPQEQETLFKEILHKKLTVRETERIARRIAVERARKQELPAELLALEKQLTESLGTRVQIEPRENGGKVHIDFFSPDDLQTILTLIAKNTEEKERLAQMGAIVPATPAIDISATPQEIAGAAAEAQSQQMVMQNDDPTLTPNTTDAILASAESESNDDDLYSVKGFTI